MDVDAPAAPQLSLGLRTFSDDAAPDWSDLLERARVLDRAGVDRLVVSDHVVFGDRLEDYGRPELGGTPGGRQPTGPDGHWLEPLTVLTAVAAVTGRIRLGTNILLAALRTPVVLAKTAATLDVLSGGRLDLGVGVGWQRAEYDAAGLDFGRRGELLDETLVVCRALWSGGPVDLRSDRLGVDVTGLRARPVPVDPGGVPVWVSGTVNRRVARRLARFGTGWIPWGSDAADLTGSVPRLRELVAAEGGPAGFGVVGTVVLRRRDDGTVDAGATLAAVPDLLAAGVTDVRVQGRTADDPAALADEAGALVEAFRSVAG